MERQASSDHSQLMVSNEMVMREIGELLIPTCVNGSSMKVSAWELVPIEEIVSTIKAESFKITTRPVVIDFLIRHGHITAENEPDLPEIVELLHLPLHNLFKSK